MNEPYDALEILKEFSYSQRKLYSKIIERYDPIGDLLENIPSEGSLEIDNKLWKFKKHGLGILFINDDNGTSIDAHRNIKECYDCFDTWRLEQYFSSREISKVIFDQEIFRVKNDRGIQQLINTMISKSAIVDDKHPGLYRIV